MDELIDTTLLENELTNKLVVNDVQINATLTNDNPNLASVQKTIQKTIHNAKEKFNQSIGHILLTHAMCNVNHAGLTMDITFTSQIQLNNSFEMFLNIIRMSNVNKVLFRSYKVNDVYLPEYANIKMLHTPTHLSNTLTTPTPTYMSNTLTTPAPTSNTLTTPAPTSNTLTTPTPADYQLIYKIILDIEKKNNVISCYFYVMYETQPRKMNFILSSTV